MVMPSNKKRENTTIQISKQTLEELKKLGAYGQTLEDIIKSLIKDRKK